MIRKSIPLGLSVCLLIVASAWAQPGGERGPSARASMERRFNESTPAIGEPLPDVSAFDEEGNEFKLSSLKGHYSVIVFGCLT